MYTYLSLVSILLHFFSTSDTYYYCNDTRNYCLLSGFKTKTNPLIYKFQTWPSSLV